jgi:hypothetical protein
LIDALRFSPARAGQGLLRGLFALALLCVLATAGAAGQNADEEARLAYEQARQALQAGQWVQAELLLERSLMFNPDHAEARLELAALLARTGRASAARALVATLIEDPRTPDAHRLRLRAMLEQPSAARAGVGDALPQDTVVVIGETFVAWTRNPLARADLSQLTLTFPEGSITLPVAQELRSGVLAGLSVQRIAPQGLSVDASVQHLWGSGAETAHRFGLSGRLPQAEGAPVRLRWLAQTQRAHDGQDRHTLALSAAGTAWRVSAGLFQEPELSRDGLYLRLERLLELRPTLQASVFAGAEQVTDEGTGFWRAGAALAWAPSPGWTLLGQASLHRDFSGYSPWLRDNAPRRMHSLDLALERAWQLAGPDWQFLARVHGSRRWSNLELFGYRDAGLQLSLRRRWQ